MMKRLLYLISDQARGGRKKSRAQWSKRAHQALERLLTKTGFHSRNKAEPSLTNFYQNCIKGILKHYLLMLHQHTVFRC